VKLYGFNNKQEFIDRFIRSCSPEYQPDGTLSDEKAETMITLAFEKG